MFNKEKSVELIIDKNTCTNCGYCASRCDAGYLIFEDNTVKQNNDSWFGCVQCGSCMMNCPTGSIKIRGEGISENDIIDLNKILPDHNLINSLFLKRRSIRKYKNQELSRETINLILEAGSTAPISIPPSEVKVLVINGFDKVQNFADHMVSHLKKSLKFFNPINLAIFKPFMSKTTHKMMVEFVVPLIKETISEREEGKDILFYNAPALIVFYGSEICSEIDQILAATHAYIAAESLGLGSCIIGAIPEVLNRNTCLREKYGIAKDEKASICFILGYPDINFRKGIKRRFKSVTYY